jgi:hypothetical protein
MVMIDAVGEILLNRMARPSGDQAGRAENATDWFL